VLFRVRPTQQAFSFRFYKVVYYCTWVIVEQKERGRGGQIQ
jgi:hypothetical protein